MKLATKSPIRNSGQDHETGDTGAPQTPRVLWKVVRTIIPISLLTFVFLTTDWSALVQTAGRAHSTPLIGAFMLYQVAILIQGSRWHVLISADGGNWPWKRVQWTNYTSTFFDGFTPGKLGSDAFRVACFRDTGKIHHLVISLLTLRLHGMAASFFMAAIVGTIVLSIKHGWLKVALPSALAAIAFAVLLGISYRFVRKGTLHVKYNNTGIKQKIAVQVSRAHDAVKAIFADSRTLHRSNVLVLIYTVLLVSTYWLTGLAFGMTLPFQNYLAVVPLLVLASVMPITIQGRGLTEVIAIGCWQGQRASQEQILLTCLTVFAIMILQGLIGGVLWVMAGTRNSTSKTE